MTVHDSAQVTVIGVDCATQVRKVGLARGTYQDGSLTLDEVRLGDAAIVETLVAWVHGAVPVLLALDAPLGWPAGLGPTLVNHEAGGHISPGHLFNRLTDRFVREQLARRPLDVGADRIARTARAALDLLEQLRRQTRETIPLAWERPVHGIQAIEVYPAATLKAHGFAHSGYKKKQQTRQRGAITRDVAALLSFGPDIRNASFTDHELDAIVCLLAGKDFLNGAAMEPDDLSTARKEGWIWVRKPS